MVEDQPIFINSPDPENPGWMTWRLSDEGRFNSEIMGKLIVRMDDDRHARMRMFPELRHTNLMNNLHGGTILALIDIAIFGCATMLGIVRAGTAVTLDLSVQFIGASKAETPIDAVTEVLKETRRLVFLRGVVEQDGAMVAAFSATIRKPPS